MYSPSSSPRRGPFGSAKGSPRKNLLSPSDVTPFSFNGPDGSSIFGSELLSQTNGIIPISIPMDRQGRTTLHRTNSVNLNQNSASRPRTQSLIPLGKSHSVGSGGMQRIRPTGSAGCGDGLPEGPLSGRSIKEYDNALRDLQRDNFNLKLRIYFLEERMGGSNFLSEKNINEEVVIDLKMTIERLKYDNNEKTELLQEARFAIEDLESQLNSVSSKREKESKILQDRVKGLETELKECSSCSHRPPGLNANNTPDKSTNSPSSLFNSPAHKRIMSSGGEEFGDSDDSLLREVEIEMRRKVNFEASGATVLPPSVLSVVHEHKEKEDVVGRQIELENRLDELSSVMKETENTLKNAQKDLSTRLIEIKDLKSEVKDKEGQLQDLQGKMERLTKSDIAKEVEIIDLRCKRNETLELLDKAKTELETEILKYDKGLRRKERIIKDLSNEVESKNKKMQELQIKLKVQSLDAFEKDMLSKDEESDNDQNDFGQATCVVTPKSRSPKATPKNSDSPSSTGPVNKWGLDVVTQSLHIPPSSKNRVPTWEVKKLREDIRILRDYLKTRVQEKRNLLQKIADLSNRIGPATPGSASKPSFSLQKVVSVSSQTDEVAFDRDSLRGRLLALAESLSFGKRSECEKTISELKVLASALSIPRQRRESGCSSSEWNGGLPDPSLLLPDLELDEGKTSQRLYSFCSNNGLVGGGDNNFSIYSMLEQFHPTDDPEEVIIQEEDEEEDNFVATAFHSEDSWSQPDVSEARHRMGIPPLPLKFKSSDFLANYTNNVNGLHNEDDNNNVELEDDDDDKEESELNNVSQRTTSDQNCIMGNCLRDNLFRMKSLMENLSYEIDYCHSIESELSENGQEDVGDYLKAVSSRRRVAETPKRTPLQVCYSCSTRLSKDLQTHLLSSNTLLQCSITAIQRLKRIIQNHEIHSEKSSQELHYALSSLSELEASLGESQGKAQEMESNLKAQLEVKSKELEGKIKENQNLKTKLNENYNLVAQLSSENLSLSKEKTKLEEALNTSNSNNNIHKIGESSPEQEKRQYPLEKMNSSYRPLSNDCHGNWTIPLKDTRPPSNLRSSPDTSSSFDFLPADNSSKKMNGSSSINGIGHTTFPLTPPPPLRLTRFGSRSSLRKKYQNRNSSVISEAEEISGKIGGVPEHKHFRSIGNLSGVSDISSPDLGVDMSSSDPFSSLERRCMSNSDAMNSIMHENYQLRRENQLLIEKLSRPKSSFKDSMD